MRRGVAGLASGLLLAAVSFAVMGMGHGVYFVNAEMIAPFAVFGSGVALVATVVMATALAVLAGTLAGTILLVAHYAGLVIVFRLAPETADFDRLATLPGWLQIIAGLELLGYAAAQVWLIRKALMMPRGQ